MSMSTLAVPSMLVRIGSRFTVYLFELGSVVSGFKQTDNIDLVTEIQCKYQTFQVNESVNLRSTHLAILAKAKCQLSDENFQPFIFESKDFDKSYGFINELSSLVHFAISEVFEKTEWTDTEFAIERAFTENRPNWSSTVCEYSVNQITAGSFAIETGKIEFFRNGAADRVRVSKLNWSKWEFQGKPLEKCREALNLLLSNLPLVIILK
jgi:hypothetical protein